MLESIDIKDLVGIGTVHSDRSGVDKTIEYARQIRNPHRFKCGRFNVSETYANNGISIEQRLIQMMS